MSTFGESSPVVPARADRLADEQHRRLVALALADHHGAADVDRVERAAHRLDGDVIGELAIAAAHQPRRRERRGLGDADDFEREVAVLHGGRCTALPGAINAPGPITSLHAPLRPDVRGHRARCAGSARVDAGIAARSSGGSARGRPSVPITAWRV